MRNQSAVLAEDRERAVRAYFHTADLSARIKRSLDDYCDGRLTDERGFAGHINLPAQNSENEKKSPTERARLPPQTRGGLTARKFDEARRYGSRPKTNL